MQLSTPLLFPALCLAALSIALPTVLALPMNEEETIPNRTPKGAQNIDCWNQDWVAYETAGIDFKCAYVRDDFIMCGDQLKGLKLVFYTGDDSNLSAVHFTSLEYRKVTEGTALVAFMFSHMKKCTPNIKTIITRDPGLLGLFMRILSEHLNGSVLLHGATIHILLKSKRQRKIRG